MTMRFSSFTLKNFLPSSNKLGCGMWFQYLVALRLRPKENRPPPKALDGLQHGHALRGL